MKFSLKMTLGVLVLLALCLTLNGYLMINRNFEDSLDAITSQNAERHYKDAGQVERDAALFVWEAQEQDGGLSGARIDGELYADYALRQAGRQLTSQLRQEKGGFAIRFKNGSPVFTAMSQDVKQNMQINAAVNGADGTYSLARSGDTVYMLISTRLAVNFRDASLISAYDITPVFTSRDAQLKNLAAFTAATLLVAVALVSLLSTLLTRPLKKLQGASERIADGDYAERTNIRSDDEIGALSGSFDRMAGAVEDKIQSLNESIREREDFVSAFTHELKTPMTSMLGYAAILRKGEQEPELRHNAAGYIWRETKRLDSLSQKLMLLMGLKNERIELEPVSVKTLFGLIQKTLPEAPDGVKVSFKNAGGTRVMADRVLLDDLLRNLITNGIRACGENGSVEVSCASTGEAARLCVKDDGRGIPADELAKIAEPFYMVDKSRSRAENGSGMGLALCARIAELHGSKLEFQSEVGKGTSASFDLALATEDER